MGCCFCVPESNVAVVEEWGKFSKTAVPGLHLLNPVSDSVKGTMSLRVKQLDTRVETKTKDNVFISVTISVQYRIVPEKVFEAYYTLNDPARQIQAYVFNSVRARIPDITLDDVFIAKEEIAANLKSDLEAEMNNYGYSIVQTLVTDMDPDAKVKKSMNEINAQQRLRAANRIKAEADKLRAIKAAEADAEAKRLSGVGFAAQRKAVIAGLGESIERFTSGIPEMSSRDVIRLMMMNQYFDTLKDIATSSADSRVIIPHSPSAVLDIGQQIQVGINENHPRRQRERDDQEDVDKEVHERGERERARERERERKSEGEREGEKRAPALAPPSQPISSPMTAEPFYSPSHSAFGDTTSARVVAAKIEQTNQEGVVEDMVEEEVPLID